jgi:hypothetical protein
MTSYKLLAEVIEGDFDLIHLVCRELVNRDQDSKGKWQALMRQGKFRGLKNRLETICVVK